MLLSGCAARTTTQRVSLGPDDTLKAAQSLLADRCLIAQGLTPPRKGRRTGEREQREVSRALFGAGRAELQLSLPGGVVISQHTDGCLAQAQRRLYGDQRRWFRAETSVNNLHSRTPKAVRDTYRELRAQALVRARAVLTERAGQKGNP